MNAVPTPSSSPMIRYAVWSWLAFLVIFFAWLIFTVAGGPPTPAVISPDKQVKTGQPGVDTGYVVNNLPPWGKIATPSLPFEPGTGYVLSAYGLQGFYQSVPKNKAWTLSSLPTPTLSAQLVKRGESPEVITENVVISWELDQATVFDDKGKEQRRGDMQPAEDGLSFTAHLPLSPIRSDGVLNPYPAVRVTAKEAGTGAIIAESAAILAVAPGFGCALCHTDAEFSILEAHDRHQGTDLQEQAKSGAPVDCRTCHDGTSEDDGKRTSGIGMSFSAAIHAWHTQYLENKGAEACLSCHTGLGRASDRPDERPRPLFARDLHIERGLGCVSCHGTLEDHSLALLKAEKESGQQNADKALAAIRPKAVSSLEDIKARLPWTQLPDCTACHDWEIKPDSRTSSAFNKWTENTQETFSAKTDNIAMLRCPTCHGAPHAVYPATNPIGRDRDNIVPIQYQQHAKPLGAAGNCALCHTQDMDFSAHHPIVERKKTAIHIPDGAKLSMPHVSFSHQSHSRLDCVACHHMGHTDGASMLCVSSGCHDGAQARKSDGSEDPMYFRRAFHGAERSCFYCHTTARMEGKAAGPTGCKDCHSAPSPRWAEEEKAAKTPDAAVDSIQSSSSAPETNNETRNGEHALPDNMPESSARKTNGNATHMEQ